MVICLLPLRLRYVLVTIFSLLLCRVLWPSGRIVTHSPRQHGRFSFTLNNGVIIPAVGLGTWTAKNGSAALAVREALRIGYRHIDTAAIYDNEMEIGEVLTELPTIVPGLSRKDIFITSKLPNSHHSPDDVRAALVTSLQRLRTSYLDLYLVHWPIATTKTANPADLKPTDLIDVPLDELWRAMENVYEEGLTKAIGVCNFPRWRLEKLLKIARVPPAVNQIELHPLLAQNSLVNFCKLHNIHVTAYAPLGSPGRPAHHRSHFSNQNEIILLDHEVVRSIAATHRTTPAQILLRFALQRGTSVIPKSTHPNRIRENFDVFSFSLTELEMISLHSLDRNYRFLRNDRLLQLTNMTLHQFWGD